MSISTNNNAKRKQNGLTKILYIHHGKGIGGAPLSLLYLIQNLDRTKYYPMVLCLYESEAADLYRKEDIETYIGKGIDDFGHSTLRWYSLRNFHMLVIRLLKIIPSIILTYRFLKSHKMDIVHLSTSSLIACAIASKLAGIKIVWHIREPLNSGYFGIRRYLIRKCINSLSDKIIPICKDTANQLINSPKIKVIYNFVDFNKFDRNISDESFRKEYKINDITRIVAMLGGIAKTKGTLEFIESAKFVKKEFSDFKFVIVGSYPNYDKNSQTLKTKAKKFVSLIVNRYYRNILKVIKKEELGDNILFTGVRRDIPEILLAIDILVFPSTVPHFARPIIEAGAMAKPVIASNIGGPDELVVDGLTGILVPPKDPESLGEAIVKLVNDESLARKMGEEGYNRAKDLFDAKKNVKETMMVYEEVMKTSENRG